MRNRRYKGDYGYIEYQRKFTALRTLLFLAISLAIYGMGIYSTGSNKNLLTIVAVLGCLPTCKSAVNLVMFLRAKGCSEEVWKRLLPFDEKLTHFYDMYFTTYSENYPISHMVLNGNVVCAFTESDQCDCKAGETHLERMLEQDGYQNVTVKIFKNLDKYIDRLSQLVELHVDSSKKEADMIQMFYSVSL